MKNVKSRRMRLMGHCACMERKEMHTGFWWGNPNKREQLKM
jgi:hypothetical protein